MAIVAFDGFDHYNTSGLMALKNGWLPVINQASGGSSSAISFPAGRLAGLACRLEAGLISTGTNTVSITQTLPSTGTTMVCGFGCLLSGSSLLTPSTQNFFQMKTAAGAAVATLRVDWTTNKLILLNAAGTVLATSVAATPNGTWAFLELKIVVNGASGVGTLKINGVADANINGITGNFGSTAIGQVFWQMQVSNTTAHNPMVSIDDYYILDTSGSAPRNDFLGDSRTETLYPNGDGSHTQWTPNTGSPHFSRVNEHPPDGDTSYVADSTPGDYDTYTVAPLSTLVGAVYGVQTNLYSRKDDAATKQIAPVVRESGTDHDGTTTAGLSTSYLFYSQLYNQDPTGSDWTIASVNACEYGVKEVV